MKKMQNVIYVMSRGKKLSVKNRSICISDENDSVTVPVHNVESVVCFGEMSITTPFMRFCAENNVTLSFLSESGTYFGTFHGMQTGNVFLRTNQYRSFENDNISLKTAKLIIDTKLKNTVRVIERAENRTAEMENVSLRIQKLREYSNIAGDKDELRGFEGAAANLYFSIFDDLINTDEPGMQFVKRSRRPPENNVNSLLSFVYTLLENDVRAAVECTGLDPQVGVLHTTDYGKPSLVLDMMEEYRAPLCDRFVISLINRKQIKASDFEVYEGKISLRSEARKKIITLWQERKNVEIYHAELGEKICVGLIPFAQARLMSAFLRGSSSVYVPFNWR